MNPPEAGGARVRRSVPCRLFVWNVNLIPSDLFLPERAAEGNFPPISRSGFLVPSLMVMVSGAGGLLCVQIKHTVCVRAASLTSPSLGENSLAVLPKNPISVGGQQLLGGRRRFWVQEVQLLHREVWKQLFHHPNAPETIYQLPSNTHKLFCQPIVLSHHIAARTIILTSFAEHLPALSNGARK